MNKIRKELMVTEHKADLWVELRTASILHSMKHRFCITQRQETLEDSNSVWFLLLFSNDIHNSPPCATQKGILFSLINRRLNLLVGVLIFQFLSLPTAVVCAYRFNDKKKCTYRFDKLYLLRFYSKRYIGGGVCVSLWLVSINCALGT